MKCIVGKKLGMTMIYDSEKGATPVTLLECSPNVVSFVRTQERDGYGAIQVSFAGKGRTTKKKEFRTEEKSFEVGATFTVEMFSVGEDVMITGTTKGKGFQGVVKRHGFHGSDQTHGHKHDHRAPGSIGSSFPEHVFKGKRMAGRMGSDRATIKGMRVVYIDGGKNILGISGPVPGSIGSIVSVQSKA